jgi:hypothetical protein
MVVSYRDVHEPWKAYPLEVSCYAPDGFDRQQCSEILSKESETLFVKTGGGIDIFWLSSLSGKCAHRAY